MHVGKTTLQHLQNIAYGRTRRRGHDTDASGQQGQFFLVRLVEKPFSGKFLFKFLIGQLKRAQPFGLHFLHDYLIGPPALINGYGSQREHFQPVFRSESEPVQASLKHDPAQLAAFILQCEIGMTGCRTGPIGDFPRYPHGTYLLFKKTLNAAC